MSDKVPLGFWCEVLGLLNIFYVDPMVMPIPAIEAQHGIAVPVHTTVQKNRTLAFRALAVDLHIISKFAHSSFPNID
ncbi:uncharacterized protein METZ01_LOCUS382826 [marine metagenome]|uniref:Uncharacterized protein n=1 Tax=marine metagenome TaxID=408172 RepID=A0A382U7H6_9ZZZZ|tara:strand:- start:94 stop:324 length:231 start_codon:yes stop_codon:yes gene_type:complete